MCLVKVHLQQDSQELLYIRMYTYLHTYMYFGQDTDANKPNKLLDSHV